MATRGDSGNGVIVPVTLLKMGHFKHHKMGFVYLSDCSFRSC
jgi:hypothetical protein